MTRIKLKFMKIVLKFITSWVFHNGGKFASGFPHYYEDAQNLIYEIDDKLEEVKQ